MSLTQQDSEWFAKREELSPNETEVVDQMFEEIYAYAKVYGVKAAKDDRCASLEAALVRFIIESREGK